MDGERNGELEYFYLYLPLVTWASYLPIPAAIIPEVTQGQNKRYKGWMNWPWIIHLLCLMQCLTGKFVVMSMPQKNAYVEKACWIKSGTLFYVSMLNWMPATPTVSILTVRLQPSIDRFRQDVNNMTDFQLPKKDHSVCHPGRYLIGIGQQTHLNIMSMRLRRRIVICGAYRLIVVLLKKNVEAGPGGGLMEEDKNLHSSSLRKCIGVRLLLIWFRMRALISPALEWSHQSV